MPDPGAQSSHMYESSKEKLGFARYAELGRPRSTISWLEVKCWDQSQGITRDTNVRHKEVDPCHLIMILWVPLSMASWWRRKKGKLGSWMCYLIPFCIIAKNRLCPHCIPIQWWPWRWGLWREISPVDRSLDNISDYFLNVERNTINTWTQQIT